MHDRRHFTNRFPTAWTGGFDTRPTFDASDCRPQSELPFSFLTDIASLCLALSASEGARVQVLTIIPFCM